MADRRKRNRRPFQNRMNKVSESVTFTETLLFGRTTVHARVTYRSNEERIRRVEEQAAQFVLHNLMESVTADREWLKG